MKATTHLIGGIPIAGHVSGYMLEVFHWLPICQQIIFRIAALVWQCLLRLATTCLHTLCSPTPGTRGCSILNSVERGGCSLSPAHLCLNLLSWWRSQRFFYLLWLNAKASNLVIYCISLQFDFFWWWLIRY